MKIRNFIYVGAIVFILQFLIGGTARADDAAVPFAQIIETIKSADPKTIRRELNNPEYDHDPRVMTLKGRFLLLGLFLDKNEERAIELFDKAASLGSAEAAFWLSLYLDFKRYYGARTPSYRSEIIRSSKLLIDAAKKGHPSAAYSVGKETLRSALHYRGSKQELGERLGTARYWSGKASVGGYYPAASLYWVVVWQICIRIHENCATRLGEKLAEVVDDQVSHSFALLALSKFDNLDDFEYVKALRMASYGRSPVGVSAQERGEFEYYKRLTREQRVLAEELAHQQFFRLHRTTGSEFRRSSKWCDRETSKFKTCVLNSELDHYRNCSSMFFDGKLINFEGTNFYNACRRLLLKNRK